MLNAQTRTLILKHPFTNKHALMNQFSSIIEAQTSIASDDDEEISAQALMINTCESSRYLGQLQTADTKSQPCGKMTPSDTKAG